MKRLTLYAGAALVLAGCGAAPMREQSATTATATMAAPPDERQQEIARLEGRIAFRRDQLGLAPAELPPPAQPQAAEQHNAAGAPVEEKPAAPVSPAPPPPPQMAPQSEVMARSPGYALPAEPEASPRPRATRCKDVASAADEICDAADHICRLADQVADEPARASCGRAREDCRHAKDLSGGCR